MYARPTSLTKIVLSFILRRIKSMRRHTYVWPTVDILSSLEYGILFQRFVPGAAAWSFCCWQRANFVGVGEKQGESSKTEASDRVQERLCLQ